MASKSKARKGPEPKPRALRDRHELADAGMRDIRGRAVTALSKIGHHAIAEVGDGEISGALADATAQLVNIVAQVDFFLAETSR